MQKKSVLLCLALLIAMLCLPYPAFAAGGGYWYQQGTGASARWFYWLDEGKNATGWLAYNGSWYYLAADGSMLSGWQKVNGHWYYFNATGAMQRGWVKLGNAWYYLEQSGEMATGWVSHKGSWYYMRADGSMATGWVLDGGKMYYLRGDGSMLSGSMGLLQFEASGALKSRTAPARKLDPAKPMIALTFDDGPSKYTGQILTILNKYNARATFFMVGNRVKANTSAAVKVVEQGSEIGSHSWDHKELTKLSDGEISRQITDTSNAIYNATGVRPILLRPPYGSHNSRVAGVCRGQGVSLVNWSVDTMDWSSQNADSVAAEILRSAKPGAVILCHDMYPSTVKAIEKVMPQLAAKGYQFVTISELLSGRGMHPGNLYNRRK